MKFLFFLKKFYINFCESTTMCFSMQECTPLSPKLRLSAIDNTGWYSHKHDFSTESESISTMHLISIKKYSDHY